MQPRAEQLPRNFRLENLASARPATSNWSGDLFGPLMLTHERWDIPGSINLDEVTGNHRLGNFLLIENFGKVDGFVRHAAFEELPSY
jgi:hypothetical protein